ncbi:MAG: hypothetical protein CMF94_05515 [Candidatus Marinimicrobia bacterium]|nr:hypothetical protein [Candidatus Neomarinimicrobiota bacterium]|tara:strand:- start:155 stop:1081 length:927 start_codon:yes stop_codon:yes gene_type:complete
MIKKYLYNFFLKNFLRKKTYMIGLSHFLSLRKDYSNISLLSDVDYKVFSQNGEDGILDYLLYQLGIQKPKFLEIGVGDYTECNTRFIFERYSACGTIIDCIDNLEQKVKKNLELWKGNLKIINEKVNSKNVHDLIINTKNFLDLDVFSLDIDGIDYWIIEKLPEDFSKIVILEYNHIFGNDLKVTVPNIENFDRSDYHYSNLCFGMSIKAAIEIMEKKNFYFIGTNLLRNNAFFVSKNYPKNKFFQNLIIEDPTYSANATFRESRDVKGNLNYLSGKNKIQEISECEVVELVDSDYKKIKIKDLFNLV